jgi:hypothetical protein
MLLGVQRFLSQSVRNKLALAVARRRPAGGGVDLRLGAAPVAAAALDVAAAVAVAAALAAARHDAVKVDEEGRGKQATADLGG